ncbi:MAG: ams [Propionibacteriaceae bacterium]|nr:ams [Propionibacteriaceae bacterium]
MNPAVLVFLRRAPTQTLVGLYNVTPNRQALPRWTVPLADDAWDALTDETPLTPGETWLEPYQCRWLVQQI